MESSVEFPQKIKNETIMWISIPTFGYIYIYIQKNLNQDLKDISILSPSLKQEFCISQMEYSSALRKKEFLPFVTTWINGSL